MMKIHKSHPNLGWMVGQNHGEHSLEWTRGCVHKFPGAGGDEGVLKVMKKTKKK